MDYITGLTLDGQTIRVEMDWGFSEDRQYGRASNGGQMRHYINEIKNSGKRVDVRYHDRRDQYHHDNRRRRHHDGYDNDREDRRRRRY